MTKKFYKSSRAFFIFSTCSNSDNRYQQSVQCEVASTGRFFLNLCDIRDDVVELIASVIFLPISLIPLNDDDDDESFSSNVHSDS